VSWLQSAIKEYKDSVVDGKITIDEFIRLVLKDEVEKTIKL